MGVVQGKDENWIFRLDQCSAMFGFTMRRPIFQTSDGEAIALFDQAETFELASTNVAGAPLLRTLHGVVHERRLYFHAAPVGEKLEIVGREAVAAVSHTIARLPSYFTDAERACPATTLFMSAQAHGVVALASDADRKATVLGMLMKKLQPEGGYAAIDASSPLYRKAIDGIAILSMPLDRVDGKAKLLQHKSPATRRRVVEALWKRGAKGDCEAIEAIRTSCPDDGVPSFLRGPGDTTLHLALGPGDAEAASRIVADEYWNDETSLEALIDAHRGSSGWVGLRNAEGRLVATARALSDGAKRGWIYDVGVVPERRGEGLGAAVVGLLIEHPSLRQTRSVHLGTRDAMRFYERLGFVERASLPLPYVSTEMVLRRQ